MANINPLLVEESLAVHLFSTEDPKLVDCFRKDNGLSVNYMRTDAHLVDLNEDPRKVVDRVLKPIGPKQKIHVLRMVAHGDAGGMRFAGMFTARWISLEWRRLRNYFDAAARLELHSCGAASETSILKPGGQIAGPALAEVKPGTFRGDPNGLGLTFLRAVVSVFGVKVIAGIDAQLVRPNVWDFTHDTVTVFPNGKFYYDSNETRGMTKDSLEGAAKAELDLIRFELIKEKKYPEAREHLKVLIRNYPRTSAAASAKLLLDTNFNPPPMVAD